MKKISISIILCFIFYRTFFRGIGTNIQLMLYTVIPLFFLIKQYGYTRHLLFNNFKSQHNVRISFSLLIIIMVASLLVPTFQRTYDYTYFERIINIFIQWINYVFGFFLIKRYIDYDKPMTVFLKSYVKISCFYVLVTLFFYLFPNLRDAWFNLALISDDSVTLISDHTAYAFRLGWNGFAGFGSTMSISLAIILLLAEFYTEIEHSVKNTLLSGLKLIILLLGNAFYGRSGLIISVILIILFLIHQIIIRKKFKMLAQIVFAILIVVTLFNFIVPETQTIQVWSEWVISPIESFLSEGSIGQDRMFNMYFLPDAKTLLFGDGWYTYLDGGYYMDIDVGYMRPILFYGFVFTMINYIIIVVLSYNIGKYYKKSLSWLIILFVLLFEIKGEAIFTILPFLLIINCMLALDVEPEKEEQYKRNFSGPVVVS